MSLFDTIVMVDWSARSAPSPARPTKDSIWACVADSTGETVFYHRTRAAAMDWLRALLIEEMTTRRRVLVGFDFPFGYPAGFARKVTGRDDALALWFWLATHVTDASNNTNNRYDVATRLNRLFDGLGPFWGCPASMANDDLDPRAKSRHGANHPAERRLVEQRQPRTKTVWQLAYNGSVGSQMLLGIPRLDALRKDPVFAGQIAVWPFETGLSAPEATIVLAEIYPTLFEPAMTGEETIKDAGQVRATARTLTILDAEDRLWPLFSAHADLSDAERSCVAREEAWILGVGHETSIRSAMELAA